MKFKIIDNFVVKHMQLGNLYIKEKNKSIVIFLFFIIFLILNQGKVHAVLQANGNDGTKYNLSDWMLNVRRMEELGGAMGLSETVNDNLTSSSGSNNIDVHMQKNTEYGALAILSASSYGNPSKVENGNTTTGNVTGVVMKLNQEWVAAAANELDATNFKSSVARYKNIYTVDTVGGKFGDGIDIGSWHGGIKNLWLSSGRISIKENSALIRSYSDSIFSYYGYSSVSNASNNPVIYADGYWKKEHFTRAVVVQGESF